MKRTVTCAMFFACVVVPGATAQSVTLGPQPTTTSMSVVDKVTLVNEYSLSSPALRLFKNKLFIAWRGLNDQLNVMSSDDAITFPAVRKKLLPAYSYSAPALASFRGRLYIAWRERDNRLSIAWSPDGVTFVVLPSIGTPGKVTLPDTSLDAPALAADHLQGKLYICWTGTDRRLYCRWSTDGTDFPVANTVMLGELSDVGPAAVVGCDALYVGWTGTDYRLNLMSSSDGVSFGNKQTLSEYTSARPALHFIHNNHSPRSRIHLFWTGRTDFRIAVRGPNAQGRELLAKLTSTEMSFVAPALESRSQCAVEGSFIGWTGTDNRLNVAKIHATDWK